MPRLLLLGAFELTRDPRARRQAETAQRAFGLEVAGACVNAGDPPLPLDGLDVVRVGSRRRVGEIRGGGRQRSALLRELRGIGRLARLAVDTIALARAGVRAGRADIVHANDFDTLPAAALLAWRWRSRLVYDAHELYSEFESSPPRFYRGVALLVERVVARRADAVVTVGEELARELTARLRLRRPPYVVLNAPKLIDVDPEFEPGTPLRAVYQGGFGPGRQPEALLDALLEAPGVELTLRVVGADRAALAAAITERGLGDRVVVSEPVPLNEVVAALRGFDVGVIFDRPETRNSELSLPNKLFEYLMAGLAIAAPRLPALGPFVERSGVGVLFEPGDPAGLGRALQTLAADPNRLLELRRSARVAATTTYNAESQAPALGEAWGVR